MSQISHDDDGHQDDLCPCILVHGIRKLNKSILVNTTVTFIDQNGDTGVSRFWPLEMAINMFQKHQKKFGTPRCGGKTGSGSLSFDPFRLLKMAKMAMFEVIPRASWRSNSGSEALFHSELTQILKFWSQNFFFHLDPWRTGMFLKGEFYRNFKIKPFRAITWKQKLLQMTNNDVWNHVGSPGHPLLSSTTPNGA